MSVTMSELWKYWADLNLICYWQPKLILFGQIYFGLYWSNIRLNLDYFTSDFKDFIKKKRRVLKNTDTKYWPHKALQLFLKHL
jgi:hypothetical protein